MQGDFILSCCCSGGLNVVSVRLIDGNHVCQLQDSFFDALQLVACSGKHKHQEEINHVSYHRFALANSDGFDQNNVESSCFAKEHGFSGHSIDPAKFTRCRRRANKR